MTTFDEFVAKVDEGAIAGAWISGGYRDPWIDGSDGREVRARLKTLVVQDLFPTPLSKRATYEIGGAAFPERDGSYVNRQHRLQSVSWAIRPPAGKSNAEGSSPLGVVRSQRPLRRSVSPSRNLPGRYPHFGAAMGDAIPDIGIDLRLNQLA